MKCPDIMFAVMHVCLSYQYIYVHCDEGGAEVKIVGYRGLEWCRLIFVMPRTGRNLLDDRSLCSHCQHSCGIFV
jgi:hypothetical protein